MPQAKLLAAEEVKNGIKITFLTDENKIFTGIYNNGNLKINDIQRLIDSRIAFTNPDTQNNLHITKAWDGDNLLYCDNPTHILDR